ncbi:hypothetical protein [Streptomyces sp. NPDC001153]
MPAGADLTLGAGDLPAVEVDVEIVAVEAVVLAVLAGGIARQWAVEGDLLFALGSFQVDQGGVAAVDQVLGRQQPPARQAGVDTGQGLAVVRGGRGGGHIRDHVDAARGTRLGDMRGEPLPADDVPVADVARRGVVRGDDRRGGGRQPTVVGGAPAQAACRVAVVVLHDDLARRASACGPGR